MFIKEYEMDIGHIDDTKPTISLDSFASAIDSPEYVNSEGIPVFIIINAFAIILLYYRQYD